MAYANRFNLTSRHSRRRENKRRNHRRFMWEQLEERALLAVDFTSLAPAMATQVNAMQTAVASHVRESAAPLPVIGQSISALASTLPADLTAKSGMLGALNKAATQLAKSNPQSDEAIRSVVYQNLQPVLGDTFADGIRNSNDVIVYSNAAQGDVSITVVLAQSLTPSGGKLNFSLGLPGVPFKVDSQAKLGVQSTVTLDRLTFGLRNNVFFAESPANSQFRIHIGATLSGSFKGTFGFFRADVSPRELDGVKLSVALLTDVNGLQLSNPRLSGAATADLQFNTILQTSGSDGGRLGLPNFRFNLYLNWQLNGKHDAANPSALGSAPTLELRNVQFGLGNYLSSVIKPVTDNLFRAFEPLLPVFDVLDDPIPGLSDLTEAVGLGEASIESVIKFATPFLSPDLKLAANAITTLIDVGQAVNLINSSPNGNEILINVGTFSLSDTNSDLRGLDKVDYAALGSPTFAKLSSLVVPLQTGLRSVRELMDKISGPLGDVVRNQFERLDREILKLENGAGFELPIIDNPTILFRLLLGEDVDLITFKAVFHADASITRLIPLWGPLDARFNGTLGFDGFFRAAYDTYGLRQYLFGGGRNAALLGNGFYLDSSRELIRFNGSISGGGALSVPMGAVFIGPVLVPVSASASLNGSLRLRGENGGDNLTVRLVDNNPNNGANKVRVFEANELNGALFAVQGELVADLNFVVEVGPSFGPHIKVFEVGLTTPKVLFTTADIDVSDPYQRLSNVPNQIPTDLVVDMLLYDDGSDGIDDKIIVIREFNGAGTPFISVYVNNERRAIEREDLVLNVVINGSADDDNITVNDVPRPVLVDGRGGLLNTLAYDDSARPGGRKNP